MQKPKFEAVDIHQLRARLGKDCSPDASKSAYVIGPDITGRLCHVGSYRCMHDAKQAAEQMNKG